MSEGETVADVLAELRGIEGFVALNRDRRLELADRIGAAHERELAKLGGSGGRELCKGGDSCEIRERNFPGAESDMGAENGGVDPAGTAGETSGHVTFGTPSPTAELREWVEQAPKSLVDARNPYNDDEYLTGNPETLLAIADRIDEAVAGMVTRGQHRRAVEQSGKALRRQNRRYREQIAQMRRDVQRGCDSEDDLLAVVADVTRERDGLKAELAEVRAYSVELPRNADGEHIDLGDVMRPTNGLPLGDDRFEVRAMRYDEGGWEIYDRLGDRYLPQALRRPKPSPYDALRERFGVRAGDGSLVSSVIDACEGVAGDAGE